MLGPTTFVEEPLVGDWPPDFLDAFPVAMFARWLWRLRCFTFVVDSFRKGLNAIKSVGGWRAAWDRMLRESYVQFGTLVGVDKYGNKYYENRSYFFSRHRFVWYPYVDRFTFDASQVPAEWHRWLHYITDDPPTTVPPEPRKFIQPHETNKTGTKLEYVPYSTTLPKIEEWVPPKNN